MKKDHDDDRKFTRLRRASDHLLYEVRMLESLTLGLASGISGGKGPLHNALVESHAIHARVLHDFFYSDSSRFDDDILASHFFSVGQWAELRPSKPEILTALNARVGKEIAHLSYLRLGEQSSWQVVEITKAIESVLEVFKLKVDRRFMSDDWTKKSIREQSSPSDGQISSGYLPSSTSAYTSHIGPAISIPQFVQGEDEES